MNGPAPAPLALPRTPVNLNRGERGILLGGTGTGKSTLATDLLLRFQHAYPGGYILVIDSKPRYRADWNINGMRQRYKGWVKGDRLPGSIAIAGETVPLMDGFRQSKIVLFQSMTATDSKAVAYYKERAGDYAEQLFRFSNAKRPCLLYCDELYDLVGDTGRADMRLLRTIRAGRERSLAVLMAAQRPRSIPLSILTEATNYYIFALQFDDDDKHLRKFGPPLRLQPDGHDFVFYRQLGGNRHAERLMTLDR